MPLIIFHVGWSNYKKSCGKPSLFLGMVLLLDIITINVCINAFSLMNGMASCQPRETP